MSWIHGLRHRLRALMSPANHAREMEEEMRFHLELDEMNEGERRRAAVRFGNQTYYREEVRRMTWYGAFDVIRQDARYAWRAIVRKPGFTAMVVLTLALGIGVNAATFSILDLLYLREPAGVQDPGNVRLVYVEHFNTVDGVPFTTQTVSYLDYREIAAAVGDTSSVALFTTDNALRMGKHPRDPRLRGVYATSNYFRVLGARTALGRVFDANEDKLGAGAPVAVISHHFWRSQLAGDSAVLGRTIEIEGGKYTIIGVMEPSFSGIELQASDVWMPIATIPVPQWIKGNWWEEKLNMARFRAVYRRNAHVPDQQVTLRATQRMRALNTAIFPKRPDSLTNVYTGPLLEARGPAKPGYQMLISTRLGGVALMVLLIACANVINLLLARAVRRRHEFAIRLALGISRSRLIRLLTTETVLLAVLATIPAVLAAWWGGSVLRALLLPDVTWYESAITWRVVLFAFGTALLAGLVAGIVPALQSSQPDLNNALKAAARTGGAHRTRLRTALVITQAALSLVLLTGSALFIRSLRNVQSLDIGYDARHIVFGSPEFAVGEDPPAALLDATLRDIAARMQSRSGVESVALGWMEPMRGMSWMGFYTNTDSLGSFKNDLPTVTQVSPGYFRTVGLRMLQGRDFAGGISGGTASAEIVVNEAFAKRLWPGQNPIGQCMHMKTRDAPCHLVVGVVENARQDKVIEEKTALQFYLPLGGTVGRASASLIIARANGSTGTVANELRRELRAAFPTAEPAVHTMMQNLEPEYRPWQLGASLFTSFGLLALVVALIGIYSTVSYAVAQRTHEFGVRIALGARLGDLLRQVVGEGVRTVLMGVVAGVVLTVAAGRLVSSLLYGVQANDAVTMSAVAAMMLASAALAALVPAWRAARVDPVTALRMD